MSTLADQVLAMTRADFEAAACRIAPDIIRTPLLPFTDEGGRVVRLKAENLQPLGSFKIRAGANALETADPQALAGGVATASAGNFAQGLALAARRRNIPIAVHVPNTAARVKLKAVRELGASIVEHSFTDWWNIISTRDTGRDDGLFIHPVMEAAVVCGNGTIGLELAADWPELDTVVVPVGGGGLVAGIAQALRVVGKKARIVACEIETSVPLTAARAAGQPVKVERGASFVDGIGSTGVLPEMWPLFQALIDDTIVISAAEAKDALRHMASRNHIIAEGAGAVAAAAALKCGGQNVVAIVSGGNLDPEVLKEILSA